MSVKTFFFFRSYHFSDQTAAFSPSIFAFTKPEFRRISAGPGPTFGSRHLCSQPTISLSHKKFLFGKFLMTSLQGICGLGSPNQKSWLRLCSSPFPPPSRLRYWTVVMELNITLWNKNNTIVTVFIYS